MLTLVSRFCFIAAIGLLVAAGVEMALSGNATPPPTALIIEEPERDLGEQPAGSHTVDFRVRNTTGQAHQIIGMAPG